MSESTFSKQLARIPYGVSVVTVGIGGAENGLTISWLSQVSFDPPMLMFAIDKKHYSTELVEDIPAFVVNLLAAGQAELAGHFAKQSMTQEKKLDSYETKTLDSGLTVLTDALACYECDVVAKHEAGDHWIIVGKVIAAEDLNEGEPLTSAHGPRYRKSK